MQCTAHGWLRRDGEPRCIRKVPPNFNTNEPSSDFEVCSDSVRSSLVHKSKRPITVQNPVMYVFLFDVSIVCPRYSLSRYRWSEPAGQCVRTDSGVELDKQNVVKHQGQWTYNFQVYDVRRHKSANDMSSGMRHLFKHRDIMRYFPVFPHRISPEFSHSGLQFLSDFGDRVHQRAPRTACASLFAALGGISCGK